MTQSLPGIVHWVRVDELPSDLAIMESVFWKPDDTTSLRQKISQDPQIRNSHVLEIGTGSGLVALCCLQSGAASVVATDLNSAAVVNAIYNAQSLGFSDRLDVRQVPRRDPGAWSVVGSDEQFDFIISNPPWENDKPQTVEQFALYDPDFQLMKSLIKGARQHLKPGGRMWLAYGCVSAIRAIQQLAAEEQLELTVLDERSLDELPELFLPGMLIELRVRTGPSPDSSLSQATSQNPESAPRLSN